MERTNKFKNVVKGNSPTPPIFLNREVIENHKNLSPKEVILSLIRAKNITQSELASRVGISKQALFNYINGIWGTPTGTKIRIAQSLEVDSSVIWDLEVSK